MPLSFGWAKMTTWTRDWRVTGSPTEWMAFSPVTLGAFSAGDKWIPERWRPFIHPVSATCAHIDRFIARLYGICGVSRLRMFPIHSQGGASFGRYQPTMRENSPSCLPTVHTCLYPYSQSVALEGGPACPGEPFCYLESTSKHWKDQHESIVASNPVARITRFSVSIARKWSRRINQTVDF